MAIPKQTIFYLIFILFIGMHFYNLCEGVIHVSENEFS